MRNETKKKRNIPKKSLKKGIFDYLCNVYKKDIRQLRASSLRNEDALFIFYKNKFVKLKIIVIFVVVNN